MGPIRITRINGGRPRTRQERIRADKAYSLLRDPGPVAAAGGSRPRFPNPPTRPAIGSGTGPRRSQARLRPVDYRTLTPSSAASVGSNATALATRYDKLDARCQATVHIAAIDAGLRPTLKQAP